MNQLYPFIVDSFGIALLAYIEVYELVYFMLFPKELTVFTSVEDNGFPCHYDTSFLTSAKNLHQQKIAVLSTTI